MAENSKIQWTDHTFNAWRGCVEVSEGCDHCYAREQAKRNPQVLGEWGADKARVMASEALWRAPLRWNTESLQQIQEGGREARVFCASIADVFEDNKLPMVDSRGRTLYHNSPIPYTLDNARVRLWTLIEHTPYLRWLLLTKRPENVRRMLQMEWCDYPHNFRHVWFGTTVENQARADERIPQLAQVPARLRFLSCEPLLGPIDLQKFFWPPCGGDVRSGHLCSLCHSWKNPIGWVIVGGESGGGARECQLEWVEEIVNDCKNAGVPVFVKQLGKRPMMDRLQLELIDRKKGGEISEWPDQLQVRQFPEA